MAAKDDDKLIAAYVPSPLAGAVERAATAKGLTKSALVRRALIAYVLPGAER
jgi:hypothetical protein